MVLTRTGVWKTKRLIILHRDIKEHHQQKIDHHQDLRALKESFKQ